MKLFHTVLHVQKKQTVSMIGAYITHFGKFCKQTQKLVAVMGIGE